MALKFNKYRRTLEQEEHRYRVHDVADPRLFRDLFPYTEIPKITFNNRVVPMMPPEEIWITDTTFRDGQQALSPFSVEQISDLFDMMHKLGGPKGIIRQSEFFIYSDKDKKAVRKCMEKGYEFPIITSWIRANKNDFKLVKEMGLKETGILTSCSDYHIFLKLKKSRKEALEMYLDIVKGALDEGITPRCHFEDITRADFYGFVVPFATELMRLAKEYKTNIRIRACDTMGYAVAYPGAAVPRNVDGIMYGLMQLAGVPSEWLEWHGHNDFYRALTNATFAWLYGCSGVNATLLGIGERTGNTPIEAMCIEYEAFRGTNDGMDLSVITDIARYFEKEIGYQIPPQQPFVGANFNVTKAGIHADGLMKNPEIYNVFDTEAILKRPPDVAITNMSGLAGITFWINNKLSQASGKKIEKDDPGIEKIKEWIDEEFAKGRVNALSNEEMLDLVKKFLPKYYPKKLK
ncbi:2-isopropylmalate synthase [Elusimicrobiota bacterium]